MQAIFIDGNDGSGKPLILRNPKAAPNGTAHISTASAFFYSGFNYGNIDPWLE